MDQPQQSSEPQQQVSSNSPVSIEPQPSVDKKWAIIGIVVLLIAVVGIGVYSFFIMGDIEQDIQDVPAVKQKQKSAGLNALPAISETDDRASVIDNEFNSLDVGDLNAEFNELDADINQL